MHTRINQPTTEESLAKIARLMEELIAHLKESNDKDADWPDHTEWIDE